LWVGIVCFVVRCVCGLVLRICFVFFLLDCVVFCL